jgi:hypothetical protein
MKQKLQINNTDAFNVNNLSGVQCVSLEKIIEKQSKYSDISFKIVCRDFLRMHPLSNGSFSRDFVIYDNRIAEILSLIKGQRFIGNSLLIRHKGSIKWDPSFRRIIRVNEKYVFFDATLFVREGKFIYGLRDNEGLLHLWMPVRKTVKINGSSILDAETIMY